MVGSAVAMMVWSRAASSMRHHEAEDDRADLRLASAADARSSGGSGACLVHRHPSFVPSGGSPCSAGMRRSVPASGAGQIYSAQGQVSERCSAVFRPFASTCEAALWRYVLVRISPPVFMPARTRLSLSQARRIALAAQGFGEARPEAAGARHVSPYARGARTCSRSIRSTSWCAPITCRSSRASAPMTGRLLDTSRLSPTQARGLRILGPRGLADPSRSASAVPLAHGPGRAGRGHLWRAGRVRREKRAFIEEVRREIASARPDRRGRIVGRRQGPGILVGLERRQAGARMAVLGRRGDDRDPARLRAHLRSARTRAARRRF